MFSKRLNGAAKLLAVLLSVMMLVSLAACGAGKTAEEPAPQATVADNAQPAETEAAQTEEAKPAKLSMTTWIQETNQKAIDALNAAFTQKNPNVTITVDTAPANDYPTLLQTRIAAGNVDLISNISAFDTLPQDFTKGCDDPAWLTFIKSGAYLDLTGQPFLANWDPNMLKNAVSYDGKVYGLDMGAVGYNGLFYSKKIFADNGLTEPGTWADFEKICKTLKDKGINPITVGAKDTWPLTSVGISGVVGASETDFTAFAKGLWTGTRKFTDDQTMKTWNRLDQVISWLEPNCMSIAYGDCPGRFVAGKAAMMIDGTWNAGTIAGLDPNFEFGYFPFPGDTDQGPNQLQGKYDMQFNIYAKSANTEACLKWMDFLSQKENYAPFVSACGFFPTMPGVESTSAFVNSMADKNKNFMPSWEKNIIPPKGVGQYAAGQGFNINLLKALGGTVGTVKELAEQAQKDWDAALKAVQ
jgi:raffinose/stachyose/melibiose transport system substrate-binding protein